MFGTTAGFLEHFGLDGISDLPGLADLKAAGLLDPLAGDADAGVFVSEPSNALPPDDDVDAFDGEPSRWRDG